MISVGFSSSSRVECIPELMAALAAQDDPGEPWEVVAIDNGTSASLQQVIEEHLPANGRYIHEERCGSSHGRNRFFAEARGDLLVLTDDDALPEPGWVKAYAEAARRYPKADLFTGPVHCLWRCRKPSWYPSPEDHEIVIVYNSDWGATDLPLDYTRCVAAHNICLRRRLLQEIGGFDPRLGPGSPLRAAGEDVELSLRLLDAGRQGYYVAAARTGHRIYDDRVKRSTLRINYNRAGYSEAWILCLRRSGSRLPMPTWWLRSAMEIPLRHVALMLLDLAAGRSAEAFYHRLRLSHWSGQMRFIKDLLLRRIQPCPVSCSLPGRVNCGEPAAQAAGTGTEQRSEPQPQHTPR